MVALAVFSADCPEASDAARSHTHRTPAGPPEISSSPAVAAALPPPAGAIGMVVDASAAVICVAYTRVAMLDCTNAASAHREVCVEPVAIARLPLVDNANSSPRSPSWQVAG